MRGSIRWKRGEKALRIRIEPTRAEEREILRAMRALWNHPGCSGSITWIYEPRTDEMLRVHIDLTSDHPIVGLGKRRLPGGPRVLVEPGAAALPALGMKALPGPRENGG
jgi:hypothetical protein